MEAPADSLLAGTQAVAALVAFEKTLTRYAPRLTWRFGRSLSACVALTGRS